MIQLLLLPFACTGEPVDTGPPPPQATVNLAFDDRDDTWLTPEGWTVDLAVGWAISTGVDLIDCNTQDLGKDHGAAVAERLRAPHVEALHAPVDQIMGTLVMDVGALCGAIWHLAGAEASDTLVDAPTDVDLVGQGLSLYLEGTATPDGGDALWFEGGTARQVGNELDLEESVGFTDIDLTVTRDLSTLFDGIAFDTATSGEVAEAVLVNLALSSRFAVD